jgi:dihydropyrimidinase
MLQAAAESISDWGDPALHPAARPPEAEVTAIRKVLAAAARQHAAVHIVHVSTPAGADLIAEARAGQRVTCETAPHYLYLDSSMLQRKDGHRWLCSPPLRDPSMREGLLERARRGMFDMFATDHCAFHVKDKDTGTEDIRTVPNGIAGIGALPHLVADLYREKSGVEWKHVVRTLSEEPARLLGLYPQKGAIAVGADADLVVLAPDAPVRPVRSTYADAYEPYPGRTTTLGIRAVLVQGNLVVRDGTIVDSSDPAGRCLWPN